MRCGPTSFRLWTIPTNEPAAGRGYRTYGLGAPLGRMRHCVGEAGGVGQRALAPPETVWAPHLQEFPTTRRNWAMTTCCRKRPEKRWRCHQRTTTWTMEDAIGASMPRRPRAPASARGGSALQDAVGRTSPTRTPPTVGRSGLLKQQQDATANTLFTLPEPFQLRMSECASLRPGLWASAGSAPAQHPATDHVSQLKQRIRIALALHHREGIPLRHGVQQAP
jgi:hypothetical protein